MKHCRMRTSNDHVVYSAVILALAKHSLKMKQKGWTFFFFAVVEQLSAELMSK